MISESGVVYMTKRTELRTEAVMVTKTKLLTEAD